MISGRKNAWELVLEWGGSRSVGIAGEEVVEDTVEESVTVVYTDGSCLGNGRRDPKAGIGVWFGTDDARNVSRRLNKDEIGEKATNNRAELAAIRVAIETVKGRLVIKSDSRYSIDCMTKWVPGWRKKGWRTSKGKPVENRDLIEDTYACMVQHGAVTFEHVKAHTGRQDPDSIGNDGADQLARRACV